MGGGSWTTDSYCSYAASTGRTFDAKKGVLSDNFDSAQELFKSRSLDPELNPKNVIRECCDSEEHPNTIPIILALDVTGSMGDTSIEIAKKLNKIMTALYKDVKDVEFLIMGIGDLAYDDFPIQASQFESDIRIAEQLDKIYFEAGGGGNDYESYTAAWLFGARHTKLDSWKRGKKGLIITIGDEEINPYLPKNPLKRSLNEPLQKDIDTKDLYNEVKDKYDLYHLNVTSTSTGERGRIENVKSFAAVIGEQNVSNVTTRTITDKIINIVKDFAAKTDNIITEGKAISW